MRIVAAVLVRMNSVRLPGKVLHRLAGKPVLGHLLDRLSYCRGIDGIVVATTGGPSDDAIEDYCRERGMPCFRGSTDDVLGRLTEALSAAGADAGVVAFGDGPLADPRIIDDLIILFRSLHPNIDFVGNDLESSFPAGTEAEVVSLAALRDATTRTNDPQIREHGTLFIRQNPQLYRLRSVVAPPSLHRPEIEIEIDEAIDLEVVGSVLEHFEGRPDVPMSEILAFLDSKPDLARRNQDVERRWRRYREDVGVQAPISNNGRATTILSPSGRHRTGDGRTD